MKLNLPPKMPHANAPGDTARASVAAPLKAAFASMPRDGFYRSPDEAARRKQAILAQMEHKRILAKVALHAGRLARQSSHL